MKRLDRYLGWAVVTGTALTLLLLTSIHTLIDFVDELNDIGEDGRTFLQALVITGLTVPRRLNELFPTSVLLGGLLGLGNLAANNELMVLRASGVSLVQILFSILKVGVILALLAFAIGEYVVPTTERQVEDVQNITKSGRISVGGRYGMWAKDGNRLVNVSRVYPDMRLEDVRVYEMEDGVRLVRSIYARSAVYESGSWVMDHVVTEIVDPEGVRSEYQKSARWDQLISPDLFDVLVIEPHKMSARTLIKYIDYLDRNDLESNQYKLAFWGHLAMPLSAVVMLVMALPFVFGPMRSAGAGQRLFIGLLIGIVFHLVNQAMHNMGLVYGMPPILAAFLPSLILLSVALFTIRRVM